MGEDVRKALENYHSPDILIESYEKQYTYLVSARFSRKASTFNQNIHIFRP